MQIQRKLFIEGEWVDSSEGKSFEVLNPATNEVITTVQRASKKDIQKAIDSAKKAFNVWGKMNPFERSKYLHRVGEVIEKNLEFIAGVETDDVGKPIYESRNIDIASSAQTFHYFADISVEVMGEVMPSPFNEVLDYTVHEPVGVIGAIIPWNFPFLIGARKIASALAAGNSVVIKPATWAPLSTLLFGEIFKEAGMPEGVLNIIPASGSDVGEVFSKSEDLGEISFTGSTEVGTKLLGSCSCSLKGCTLELGGKSPAVVLPDCNLEETVEGILFGVYLNQGECCCAATRIIVHDDIYDEFLAEFIEGTSRIRIGLPRNEDTRLGAIVHREHLNTIMEYIDSGKKEGATLVYGGNILDKGELSRGNFVEPTIFVDVKPSMKIWKEEIFGPVIVICKAKDTDEMVNLANDTKYGLAASIWTTNLKKAHILAAKIEAGTVWLNLHNFVFPSAPYGGYKASGIGRELGKEGVLALTRTKNIMVNLFEETFKWY